MVLGAVTGAGTSWLSIGAACSRCVCSKPVCSRTGVLADADAVAWMAHETRGAVYISSV